VKFQRALPFCVFPVSPQLAALHNISQSSPVHDSCKSCGSYLSTHVTVVRNRQHSRVIKTTCNACGRVHSIPLQKGNSTTFPSRKRKASTPIPIPDISLPLLSTNQSLITSTTSTPAASSTKLSKPLKNNKKSGLHDMLKKNREREQEQKRAETSSGGLSAFLTTL